MWDILKLSQLGYLKMIFIHFQSTSFNTYNETRIIYSLLIIICSLFLLEWMYVVRSKSKWSLSCALYCQQYFHTNETFVTLVHFTLVDCYKPSSKLSLTLSPNLVFQINSFIWPQVSACGRLMTPRRHSPDSRVWIKNKADCFIVIRYLIKRIQITNLENRFLSV